jgi:hypothetical protein
VVVRGAFRSAVDQPIGLLRNSRVGNGHIQPALPELVHEHRCKLVVLSDSPIARLVDHDNAEARLKLCRVNGTQDSSPLRGVGLVNSVVVGNDGGIVRDLLRIDVAHRLFEVREIGRTVAVDDSWGAIRY